MRIYNCANCGAEITPQEGNRDFAVCSSCGYKLRLDDYQYTNRIVDEAEVKRVELDKMIELKKLELQIEMEKNKKAANKKTNIIKIVVGLFLFVLSIVMFALCCVSDEVRISDLFVLVFFLGIFFFSVSLIVLGSILTKAEENKGNSTEL